MSVAFPAERVAPGLVRGAVTDPMLGRWLAGLDARIRAACDQWDLTVLEALPAQYSVVLAVIRGDGGQAVLKVVPPDDFAALELPGLRAYAGTCAPLVLAYDGALDAMLLERVTPARPLRREPDDDRATTVLAEVMSRLWSVAPARLRPPDRLSVWAATRPEIMRFRARRHAGLVPRRLLDQAVDVLSGWDDGADEVILHGDLHHGNVLTSNRCGWVAIDPSSRLGRREADVAAMLRNPWGAPRDPKRLRRRHGRRLAILREVLALDVDRCRRWAFANSVDLAIWSATCGRDDDADFLFTVAHSLDEGRQFRPT